MVAATAAVLVAGSFEVARSSIGKSVEPRSEHARLVLPDACGGVVRGVLATKIETDLLILRAQHSQEI